MKRFTLFTLGLLLNLPVWASPININTAAAPDIAAALNGIGQAKAEAIVAYRDANGAFKSEDELMQIKGIGQKLLDKIRADIKLAD